MEDDGVIKVEKESFFGGKYRLEYDGKYITLFGLDKGYPVNAYGFDAEGKDEDGKVHYEEMVLVSCVLEIRNASPAIVGEDEGYIYIKLHEGGG